MPTGVAIRDVREQLFAAAERILLRAGPGALTSRAVTAEAGCAKGVLHRHFADFDAFLAELIRERTAALEGSGLRLWDAAGIGTVTNNVTGALLDLFASMAPRVVALVIGRDELRARLQPGGGLPMLNEGSRMIAEYLAAERDLGRLDAGTDVSAAAVALVGGVHLLYAGQDNPLVEDEAVLRIVTTILAGHLR
ncbi:TetR/AcrR family transcriptional regulator [Paractinoplanes rishiriensis]|uniref:TetR family transcriptional regulator n=1 Tax=Paractinoplanes rishiriensis TaxID=1050105 RepID=A0A919K430_9ACTN|nr:TetR/AcrR family transcriptional regulator [Actinoplanes rishiriensis]GIE98927.1 TetR family transcriptional regulator [Actinoplanes rishiriensis]